MTEPEENKREPCIFDSIGICFSGGGYRASSFTLGVLSYLNHIQFKEGPLLDKVSALSTVSGGTITGATFTQSKIVDQPFETFYHDFYSFLEKDLLLDEAIGFLMDDELWEKQTKRRNWINSFALAYERLLVDKTMVDMFHMNASLKHVCFNATEFTYGLAFRFQNTGKFGNYYLQCNELKAFSEDIKFSDAIASSSCFPIGFEPLVFPDDYSEDHTASDYKLLKQKPDFKAGIGIMDGGIVDNQGIGSMMNFIEDTMKKASINLIMVNDVGSFRMDPWVPELKKDNENGDQSLANAINRLLSIFRFRNIYWITMLAGFILVLVNGITKEDPALDIIGGLCMGIGLTLTIFGLVTMYGTKYLKAFLGKFFKRMVPPVLLDDLKALKNLNISTIRQMIIERMSSALVMVDDIFLRQLRRLNYDLLYARSDLREKIITTTVYQLNGEEHSIRNKNQDASFLEEGTEKIRASSLIASQTPTTLWWDAKDREVNRLANLVACGQFTTCFNLLVFIKKMPEKKKTPAIIKMSLQLERNWEQFKKDPLFMV
ncbi:MAG: patatin-like phospholipase family protein [Cyclobacteriaceae bacterium]